MFYHRICWFGFFFCQKSCQLVRISQIPVRVFLPKCPLRTVRSHFSADQLHIVRGEAEGVSIRNIHQKLVNTLHGLLNCEIGGLDCRVITTEYRTRHCPLYTHVTHILQCVGPYYLFGRVWSMFVYNIYYFLQNSILSLYFLITTHIAIAIGDSLTTWFYTFIGYGLMEGGVYQNVHVGRCIVWLRLLPRLQRFHLEDVACSVF